LENGIKRRHFWQQRSHVLAHSVGCLLFKLPFGIRGSYQPESNHYYGWL